MQECPWEEDLKYARATCEQVRPQVQARAPNVHLGNPYFLSGNVHLCLNTSKGAFVIIRIRVPVTRTTLTCQCMRRQSHMFVPCCPAVLLPGPRSWTLLKSCRSSLRPALVSDCIPVRRPCLAARALAVVLILLAD